MSLKIGGIWCLFVLMLYIPINNFSVMLRQFPFLLGSTSTKQWIKCPAKRHNPVTPVSLELATL